MALLEMGSIVLRALIIMEGKGEGEIIQVEEEIVVEEDEEKQEMREEEEEEDDDSFEDELMPRPVFQIEEDHENLTQGEKEAF